MVKHICEKGLIAEYDCRHRVTLISQAAGQTVAYMSSRRYREEHTISRVVKSESLQQCSIIKKTAAVKKGITVVEESESHRYRSKCTAVES